MNAITLAMIVVAAVTVVVLTIGPFALAIRTRSRDWLVPGYFVLGLWLMAGAIVQGDRGVDLLMFCLFGVPALHVLVWAAIGLAWLGDRKVAVIEWAYYARYGFDTLLIGVAFGWIAWLTFDSIRASTLYEALKATRKAGVEITNGNVMRFAAEHRRPAILPNTLNYPGGMSDLKRDPRPEHHLVCTNCHARYLLGDHDDPGTNPPMIDIDNAPTGCPWCNAAWSTDETATRIERIRHPMRKYASFADG